jgi:hypothetical protein
MPEPLRDLSDRWMRFLSSLLLSSSPEASVGTSISQAEFNDLLAVAHSNHVIVRGMEVFRRITLDSGDEVRAGWAESALDTERARIAKAIKVLRSLSDAFNAEGLDLTVIKSLDHWPDFGSDIDLYTNASAAVVCPFMKKHFGARLAPQSWGDRLACKWNFYLPDIPDPVEIHMGRLGQTGEQMVIAANIPFRSRLLEVDGQSFRVSSPSDRLMISTLQRMYRHFYFRLCDIVDSTSLVRSGMVDFDELRSSARAAGIWEGVATYLVIVSDYVQSYGTGLDLPSFVREGARFYGDVLYFGGSFLRVPIMPQSASLYRSQFADLVRRRQVRSSARLGLLPPLATAAAIAYKITGSDKGIW